MEPRTDLLAMTEISILRVEQMRPNLDGFRDNLVQVNKTVFASDNNNKNRVLAVRSEILNSLRTMEKNHEA